MSRSHEALALSRDDVPGEEAVAMRLSRSRIVVGALASAVILAAIPSIGLLPTGFLSTASAARAEKETICHATHSASNPYRRITVSKNAVNRSTGHKIHNSATWTSASSNGGTWGDVIPGVVSGVSALNYKTGGSGANAATDSEERGYRIFNGGSYASTDYTGKCPAMTAKQFYDYELSAGQTSAQALASLDDMAASEDLALRAALGGSFAGSDPTALTSISATTRAPSSITYTGATFNGTLTVGSTSTTPSFLYGTVNPPTTSVAGSPSSVTGTGSTFTAAVTGLVQNTTYYVQAVGTYELVDPTDSTSTVLGTVVGDVISFVTPSSAKTNQTITFGSLTGKAYGDPNFTLTTPTATSGLTVTVTSATPSVCTISTLTVTITGVGSCILTADQAGNGTYNAAPSVEQSFTVSQGAQTITFGSIPSKVTSSSAFAVSPTASSGLTVALSSSTTGICTVSSLTITLTGTRGTCTVTAAQAGNTLYSAAANVAQSFAVNADQTITFGSIPSKVTGFSPFTVAPTATSGLTVTLSSSTTGICTVSTFTVSYVTDGTCTLVASQAGDSSTFYNAASNVTQSFTIAASAKTPRTITVAAGSTSLTYNGTTALTSTASAGDSDGVKTYSVLTGPGYCSISGTTLTAIGVGSCTIGVTITETSTYDAASSTNLVTISVGRASRVVTVASSTTSLAVGGTATLSSATSGGGTETFSLATGGSYCSVSGSTLTATATGSCTVQVTIAADAFYDAASSTNLVTITVNSTSRTITVATSDASIMVGGTATLSSTASAGTGSKTYSILTGSSSCSLATTTVTGTAAGACTVGVSIAADSTYGVATSSNLVTITVTARGGGSASSSGSGNSGSSNVGGNSSSTPSAAATVTPSDDKKIKPITASVSFSAAPAGGSVTTAASQTNAGGNALRLEPVRVDPLPRAEIPMVTADNRPVTVTKATSDGPAKAIVDSRGTLQLIVPIGYSGTTTVQVEGSAKDGSGGDISETIEVKVQGPIPAVVPSQAAADRPRLMPDRPGVVNVLGLDSEAALSWKPRDEAAAYEVYSGGKLVCLTVYSSCIVPALNNRSAKYRVDAVSSKGRSLTIGTGVGSAQKKGSLLGRVYFDSTESKLTKASRATLKKMVNDLQAMGLRAIAVNGYTDALGSQRYNLELSNKRASQVRSFLRGKVAGLIPVRKPFGEKQLVKDESRRPGRWQNRRVEIRVM